MITLAKFNLAMIVFIAIMIGGMVGMFVGGAVS